MTETGRVRRGNVPESHSLKMETNVAVPMRDGTILYADLYRPEGPGPCPVLLQRTPYDKSMPVSRNMLDPLKAARHGYVVVIQDTRGRYTSGGEFYPFRDDLHDGYDTVEWVASQPWSSGKVGMYGNSYVGATQWQAAKSCPPHLVAIAPRVTASNYHEGWTYQGGAFELGFTVSWTLGNLTLANFPSLAARKPIPQDRRVKLAQAVDALEAAFRFLPLKELPHLQDGLADYFYDWLAHPDYDDYWKRLSIEEYHSRITVPALNIGGWYDIFLGGTLRNYLGMREQGATEEARRGQKLLIGPWQLCCHAYFMAGGAYDQQEIERRHDVLVYSTPPLERDVEVTGPITVTLWAATSAADTDFTAKLVDVCEHGCARNLTDGIIRARYRDSTSTPSLVEPGRASGYTIDLWATSNVFQAGHRIRVEISSSNFPRFDRNTNTGRRIAEDTELTPALQTILHNAQYPSHITLPIVPR